LGDLGLLALLHVGPHLLNRDLMLQLEISSL
jgi:hypothetical protein